MVMQHGIVAFFTMTSVYWNSVSNSISFASINFIGCKARVSFCFLSFFLNHSVMCRIKFRNFARTPWKWGVVKLWTLASQIPMQQNCPRWVLYNKCVCHFEDHFFCSILKLNFLSKNIYLNWFYWSSYDVKNPLL